MQGALKKKFACSIIQPAAALEVIAYGLGGDVKHPLYFLSEVLTVRGSFEKGAVCPEVMAGSSKGVMLEVVFWLFASIAKDVIDQFWEGEE